MNTSDKYTQKPLMETNSPLVAKYAWMTSDKKEDWECGMRNALPEMPASIRKAIQVSLHEKSLQDGGLEDA